MHNELRDKAKKLNIETRAYIDGEYVSTVDGDIIEKTSPTDRTQIQSIASCKLADINKAVMAAEKSFNSKIWLNTPVQEKKRAFFTLATLIEQNKEELALLDTLETGRAFKNYYYDSIPKAITTLQYFAEAIDKYYDYAIPPRPDSFATITKEPLGVIGLITPWNDPQVVSMWKIAPALLMGNSVIIKPAEQSTYSILKIAALTKQAGIPDGVFNVTPGFGNIAGKSLALHERVNGVFFTGSSEVGKKILTYSGNSNMKKVGLECGGKSPYIVSKNCNNIKKAAEVLAKNIFYNQGQICSAPSRAIIADDIKSEFLEYMKIETEKYIPANPFLPDSQVGCIVSKEQKNKIEKYISLAEDSGAIIFRPPTNKNLLPDGYYIVPIIIDLPDPDAKIAQEEIFGPVLIVNSAATTQEAISIANNSKYGLAASVWTNNLDEAYYVSRELLAGIVHINSYGDDDDTVPFGGIKESGIGKDKSIFAFDEYSYTKTTWVHLDKFN